MVRDVALTEAAAYIYKVMEGTGLNQQSERLLDFELKGVALLV